MKKWLSVLCVLLLVAMSSAAIAGDETKVDAEPGMQIEQLFGAQSPSSTK